MDINIIIVEMLLHIKWDGLTCLNQKEMRWLWESES